MDRKSLGDFARFMREFFTGPTRLAEVRELFMCRGDPRGGGQKDRGGVWVEGLETYILSRVRGVGDLRRWNVFMGVGFWRDISSTEPRQEIMLYDRLSFDFDCEEDPRRAVDTALQFSNILYSMYRVTPLVFVTGFKGAHVVIPLTEPVGWDLYQLLWDRLYLHVPHRTLVDKNMKQWNRVDRVPLTYNVKDEGVRFCRAIYPRSFTWRDFSWSELEPLNPSAVEIVKVVAPEPVKPKLIVRQTEKRWIWKVVESGLPDGRHRFMLYILIPYLAVVKEMPEEEILTICRTLVENSCKNFGKCDKVYDSWIRSAIRSAKNKGFKGFGLAKLREKDPELYSIIAKVLEAKDI